MGLWHPYSSLWKKRGSKFKSVCQTFYFFQLETLQLQSSTKLHHTANKNKKKCLSLVQYVCRNAVEILTSCTHPLQICQNLSNNSLLYFALMGQLTICYSDRNKNNQYNHNGKPNPDDVVLFLYTTYAYDINSFNHMSTTSCPMILVHPR